jgi:DNA polymerase (family 10)
VRDVLQIRRDLQEIAALLALSPGTPRYKVQAYARGAEVVGHLASKLGELIEHERLTELNGIGSSLAREITEDWRTGQSPLLTRLRAEFPPGTGELAQVPGLTARRIKLVQDQLGITDLDALETACQSGLVARVPGLGAKLAASLPQAIEGLRKQRLRYGPVKLLLPQALALAERLTRELAGKLDSWEVIATGALRRREEVIEPLELLIVADERAVADTPIEPDELPPRAAREHNAEALRRQLREVLTELPSVVWLERETDVAWVNEGARVTFSVVTRAEAGFALLTGTGPAAHVIALQARAGGNALDELAGRVGAEDGAVEREASIYARLGVPPVPAEVRSVAKPGEDFADLLSDADVRGAVHCHTTYSDGKHGIEEMALAAQALGFEYITITDHSPAAYYAHGVALDRLARQWDEIAEVQERVSIRLLRGTESDILADGSLDYPDHVLERLDVVIASIHSRFGMDKAQMTERLVRAMQLPVYKIWGHALGRQLLEREPLACDVEAVLDALASSRGAIELNGDPHRLDLPPEWIPGARARGIPFVTSVDAHSTKGLAASAFAVMMARRGGLRRGEVLNTLPVAEFMARVKP